MYKAREVPAGSRVRLSCPQAPRLAATVLGLDADGMYAVQVLDDEEFPGHACGGAHCPKLRKKLREHFTEFPGGGHWVNRSDIRIDNDTRRLGRKRRSRRKGAPAKWTQEAVA